MPVEIEKPQENCGIVGIIDLSGREAVHRAVAMLGKEINRGQDAAGVVTKNHGFHRHRQMGVVPQIFTDEAIIKHQLEGSLVIGHTRYRIQGGDTMDFTQPILVSNGQTEIALAHNGNVSDLGLMKDRLAKKGVPELKPDYDSNYLAHVIAYAPGRNYIEKIQNGLRGVEGSYSLVIATQDGHLLGVRDPWANRPLSLTQMDKIWAIASETSAFQAIKATDKSRWHEFNPGEIIDISAQGVYRSRLMERADRRECIFEDLYLGYDTSVVKGRTRASFRGLLGKKLAQNHPGTGTVVGAVPEAARSAAHAFAYEAGLPEQELVKKAVASTGRSFIAGEVRKRKRLAENKFDVSPDVEDVRPILVDDSVVLGTTAKILIEALVNDYGSQPPDLRSTAPKVIKDCERGVTMRSRDGVFLAVNQETGEVRSDQEMAAEIGAGTLEFLSLNELEEVVEEAGQNPKDYCTECFGGQGFGPLTTRAQRPIIKEFVWPNS